MTPHDFTEEPCPECGKMNTQGEYTKFRHAKKFGTFSGPKDVRCTCGTFLRHTVPIFKVNASGWIWSIITERMFEEREYFEVEI